MTIREAGFTLIELMIVVAIIAILSSVAYPAYTAYTERVNRSSAQTALKMFAVAMEKVKLEKYEYRLANGNAGDIVSATTPTASLFFSQAPLDSSRKTYDLTIEKATTNSFIIRATPIAGSLMAGDGYFQLSSTGLEEWDQNNNTSIENSEKCWAVNKGSC